MTDKPKSLPCAPTRPEILCCFCELPIADEGEAVAQHPGWVVAGTDAPLYYHPECFAESERMRTGAAQARRDGRR